ncbi:hypothetical protein C440_06147 [Haloferax mucosum ATCC BAA-1512]|uniref:Uncharacterized protein n=1 Tax=Haloferax mucosum ATCC BAA-1512 TaxID=662479 RepID=M0IJ04_9EURY|nr:DUF6498-containing protein [Haloferax mucosum]ELZ95848.1 hypothetical protein C440_06147 [Haloferax mucosum ATCC BAA-1512]
MWRRTLAGVAAANALPLVGILLFDWGLAHLLVVYWVEITVGALRQTLEATFAGQRAAPENWAAADSRWGWRSPFRSLREKRGSFRLHRALPPAYPRSFPRVLGLGRVVMGLSLISGAVLWFATAESGVFVESLLLAGVTTLAREGTTFADHVRSRDYRELVPQSILTARSLLESVAFVVIVVWGTSLDLSQTENTGFLFMLVYSARVGFDVYTAVGQSERFDPLAPSEADFETADDDTWAPVSVPDGDPTNVLHTNRHAVWVGAVVDGILGMLNPRRFAAAAVIAFLGYVVAGVTWAVVGASAVVVVVVAHTLVERDLRWGHVEYRVCVNSIVCHDCLLDEPQWRVERERVTDVTDRSGLLGRLPGVSSVSLEQRDDSDTRALRYLDPADVPVAERCRNPKSQATRGDG